MALRFQLTVLLLFSLFSTVAAAKTTYVIGVENQPYLPHYSFENGEFAGFTAELLNEFSKQSNISIRVEPYPVKRLFKYLLEGQIDFKYPDSPRWQQAMKKKSSKTVYYSDKVVQFTDGTMVLRDNYDLNLAGLKELGTIRGFTPWPYLQLIESGKLNKIENSSLPGLLKQTLLGRVQGAYLNVDVAKYQLELMQKSGQLVLNKNLPFASSYYYMSSVKHEKLLQQFNHFLATHRSFVDSLKVKYQLGTQH
jgi:ABC-type amino acid transport substrate-binding protein